MKEPQKYTRYIRQKDKTNKKNTSWEFDFDTYQSGGEVEKPNQPKVKVGKGFAPHGGLILKNIHNSGFRMAYDIGVVGIYAFPGPVAKASNHDKPRFLILGPPDFVQVNNETFMPLDPNKTYNPIVDNTKMDSIGFNMATYNTDREQELKVTYRSNDELFGEGSGYLFVVQKFIMTKYSDKPAHEPTGGLKAARLFPITQLIYNIRPSSKHKIEDYVESFRVDYRLYINLDTYAKEKIVRGFSDTANKRSNQSKTKINNTAGFFKDEDETPKSYKELLQKKTPENVVFSASEKPIVAEMITEGLNPKSTNLKWDNIHWWGFGKNAYLGSTPGSFHAVHVHWRWSNSMQVKFDDLGPDPEHEGEIQFKGRGINGALVDPTIKDQILRIAVIKNKNLPKNNHEHRSINFKDFFINLRSNKLPEDLENGGDIILYYSSEIKLKDVKKTSEKGLICSVFVHGLFFAHEIEQSTMMTGTKNDFYKHPEKPSNKKWERYPEK